MIASRGRRAALAAIAACALAPLAHAQDPRSATVQDTAREWLALVDKLDVQASYQAAGAKFREALTPEAWAAAVKSVREPLGAVVQRAAATTAFVNRLPGHPPGDYALIGFRTSFEKDNVVRELVTLEVDAYRWRVVGYSIQQ